MKKLLLSFCFSIMVLVANAQCTITIMNLNNACSAGCSGFVSMNFQGGVMPYSLTMTGPVNIGPFQVTSAFSQGNLCPGFYEVQLIDGNNDTCTVNFNIIPVPPIDLTIAVTNATCSLCNDGTATITGVSGGNPPFSYQWSNGAIGSTITGLAPGTYTCYVTDANGCFDVDTFYIGVGAGPFLTISGQAYYDTNANGLKDVGEPGLGNQNVLIQPGAVNAITNNNGGYGMVVGPGTYDISYLPTPGWSLTSLPATHNVTVSTASIAGLDFGVYPDSTSGSAAITITSGFPRCFWDVPYYLTIINTGFTILNGSAVFTHDPLMTYVSSSVIPFSQIGNQLSYTFSNLLPGQSQTIVVTLTEPAGGTFVSNTFSINANDNFGNQFAENTIFTQSVSCSYDPNDKQVQPIGIGGLNYVAMDEWLNYQVRFQNTGNDTAFRVVIIDTLHAALDLSTFTLTGASHPVAVTMRAGNEVSFIFDNILLPDSNVNEPASNGYVQYRIKGLSTNPDPTSVTNTAYIYFDLNTPVQTNVTLTTFSDNYLGIADNSGDAAFFSIYPNPMNNGAMLQYDGPLSADFEVEILDISGRRVLTAQKMKNNRLFLPKGDLNAGTYLVKINAATITYLRLVVQ